MKKLLAIVGTAAMAGTLGLTVASPAQAACGQQDLNRNPDSYVFLNWSYSTTYTRVEPHGGPGTTMRAVIARYTGSGLTYYYGDPVTNPASTGNNRSYVSASNGTHAGNWYRWGNTGYLNFYNDYDYCKPGV